MEGWFILNTDDSSLRNPVFERDGGVLRDHNRNWVHGFSRNIGHTNNMLSKLWGLRDGLHLAVARNFEFLEIEVDSKAVIDIMHTLITIFILLL